MNRKILSRVATGAVALGIGAAGIGAVVANGHSASAQNSTPVAGAPATTSTTTGTQTSNGQGSLLPPQGENEGPDGGGQANAATVQTGATQAGGGAATAQIAGGAQGG